MYFELSYYCKVGKYMDVLRGVKRKQIMKDHTLYQMLGFKYTMMAVV